MSSQNRNIVSNKTKDIAIENELKKLKTFDVSYFIYDKENSHLFVNGIEIHKFKAKDFEIHAYSLCLGNISKD